MDCLTRAKSNTLLLTDEGFESPSGCKKSPPTRGKARIKIIYKVMEKKFIYSKDLGEILEELAEEAYKHSDRLSTHVTIRRGCMEVSVIMNTSPYTTLSSANYEIIPEITDSTDALDHIFGDALVALEDLSVIKQNEVETDKTE